MDLFHKGYMMKNMKYIFLLTLVFMASPLFVNAHPGNTDSSGGHYCRTNCSSWGVPWNQWHSHSGGLSNSFTSSYAPSTLTVTSNMDCPAYAFAYLGSCYELPANAKKSAFSGFTCNYGYEESGFGLYKKCLPEIDNGYRIGTSIFCDYGYKLYGSLCLKNSSGSGYSYSAYDSSLFDSSNSCPKNSSIDPSDSEMCLCDLGYEVNKNKDACKKTSKKTNDKICRADFGKNSMWSGKYDKKEKVPTCTCKKGFAWNSAGDSCVK